MDESGQVLNRAMEDPVSWHGVLGHWHVSAGKWDPGPGFDWERVFHALRGEDNFFPVNLANAGGRSGLTRAQMQEEAEEFFRNTEERMEDTLRSVSTAMAWRGAFGFLKGSRSSHAH